MTRTDEEKLRASLTAAMEIWWENIASTIGVRMPYLGSDSFVQMASAAATVLIALDDAQRSMISDGIVKSDDF